MEDNEELDAFLQRALSMLLDDTLSVDDLVALTLETGKFGVDGMAMLDKANTSAYGNPEITKVNIGVRSNPAILVSGHDLRDLEMLLELSLYYIHIHHQSFLEQFLFLLLLLLIALLAYH